MRQVTLNSLNAVAARRNDVGPYVYCTSPARAGRWRWMIVMAPTRMLRFLKPSCVVPQLAAETKFEAIDELLAVLDREGLIRNLKTVRHDVLAREKQMSTGITDGLALPHAKSNGARDLAVAFGMKAVGIPFDSLDGRPATAIFLVVSRVDRNGPHLQCLAEITTFYSAPERRKRLLQARSVADVIATLGSA